MKHGLSFDIEDYHQIIFQDYFLKDVPPTAEVEANTHWLLDTLAEAHGKATFFLLGNVARTYPAVAKRIVEEGHEIGVHGYDHKYIGTLTPNEFRDEIKRAKDEIENSSGGKVVGHRAPAFSITADSLWAIDVLKELNFIYDSSIYPFAGRRYGMANVSKNIYRWPNNLYEIPLSCLTIAGKTIPVAGGGYIRHFPYWWTKYVMRRLGKINQPAIVYMHPYEFEYSSPSQYPYGESIPRKLRIHNILQSLNRGKNQRRKFLSLLADFTFVPLNCLIDPAA